MEDQLSISLMWWITAVEVPALTGLFWLLWRTRRDSDQAIHQMRQTCELGFARLRENFADYKLEVAKSYASIAYLKDVEKRLTGHLLRIEAKLDIRWRGEDGGAA